MEIEDAQLLIKNYLNEKMISMISYKTHSDCPGLFDIRFADQTFDISSQLLNHGAQYVISNFTKDSWSASRQNHDQDRGIHENTNSTTGHTG
jgi:hypothetical protein